MNIDKMINMLLLKISKTKSVPEETTEELAE